MSSRWYTYQKERFPLLKNGLLVGVFCISILLFSGLQSSGPALPGTLPVLAAMFSTLLIFFQLRVADEIKDYDADARYRPERPVPRGLVTLRELGALAFVAAAVQFAIAVATDVGLVPILVFVWLYMWLMTREFFVPDWLRRHPVAYMLSHMLVMPMIGLYVSAFDWRCLCNELPAGLGWLLAMSFFTGLVLEIGRKVKTASGERDGVDTYSALWGPARSAAAWAGCAIVAALLYLEALSYISIGLPGVLPALAASAIATLAAIPFIARGAELRASFEKAIEGASGLVTLCLYAGLGPLQLLLGD
ncbi:MAG: UbiA family prenyltransferase [Gammaproteobacteria bacterium]|nr:UbiA family prenyltransferase [Gammaproteobacteria bacterium]MDH4255613.1 UbiA family prenyltransferase [Gammaproteobacteria bacterium]MDH5310343.1 UbiA family prenyltransferase [Gammaproteobacteria bacterium]